MFSKSQPEHVLAALLEVSEDAVLAVSPDGMIRKWSHGAQKLYGYSEDEVIGRPLSIVVPLYEKPALERLLLEAGYGEIDPHETCERLRKDGSRTTINARRGVVRSATGETTLIVEVARESSRRFGPNGPGWQEPGLERVIDALPLMIWTTDRNLRITSNWGSGTEVERIRGRDYTGKTVFDLLKCHEFDAGPIVHHQNALHGLRCRFEYQMGNSALDIQLGPLRNADGDIVGCTGVALDITERKKAEEDARFQATHDALTGLANYREFLNTLEREARRAGRSHRSFAVLLLDLDELKRINDQFGHLAGNRALKRLAAAMKENSRATDVASRYGGDEFALLLLETDTSMAEQVAERIRKCLAKDGGHPALKVSIGGAVCPNDGRSAQELLEAADERLYRRKREARAKAV